MPEQDYRIIRNAPVNVLKIVFLVYKENFDQFSYCSTQEKFNRSSKQTFQIRSNIYVSDVKIEVLISWGLGSAFTLLKRPVPHVPGFFIMDRITK